MLSMKFNKKIFLIIGLSILLLYCLSFMNKNTKQKSIDAFIQIGQTTFEEAMQNDPHAQSGGSMVICSFHLLKDGRMLIVEYENIDTKLIASKKSYSDDVSLFSDSQ